MQKKYTGGSCKLWWRQNWMGGWGKKVAVLEITRVLGDKTVPPYLVLQVNDYVVNDLIAFAKRKKIFHMQKPDVFQSQPLLVLLMADSEKHVGT